MNEPRNTPQSRLSMDPFAPGDIARRLEAANVSRASLPARRLLLLGLVGGVYISFGGALATLVLTDNILGYGLGRFVAGLAFSLGLIMLVVAGGELFTGNNLMVLALAGRKITFGAMLRNWAVVYPANAAGAVLLAFAIHYAGVLDGNGVKATAVKIAEAKAQLDPPDGLPARRPVQHAGVPGGVAERGRPQRRGQGGRHRLPDQRLRGARLRALRRQFLPADHRPAERRPGHAAGYASNIAFVTAGNTLGGILIALILYLIYLGKDQVLRSRVFSRPIASPVSGQDDAPPAHAANSNEPSPEQAPAEEPVQTAAVRFRLKSMHADAAASPPKDPVRTRPSWLEPRSKDGQGRH